MNKKTRLPFFALAIIGTIFYSASCKKADIKFGEEFLDNDIAQIYKTDSFGVNVSTVYLDSFITSNKGSVLIGAYNDDFFGKIATQSYFELIPPAYQDVYANTTFDSLCLILKTSGIFYGDSTIPINITVDELKDSIYLKDEVTNFYNTNSFNIKGFPDMPLANKNIVIRPQADKEINIKLPASFGNTLLNKLKDVTDNTLKTSAAFLSYFKGIRLSSSAASQMIVNCNDDVVMRLYYKTPAILEEHKFVDFTLSNKSHQFNNIKVNKTGKVLEFLSKNNREIPSTASANIAYTQATSGSMIKLSFPTIKDIQKLPNFAKVLKASLVIKPIKTSYNSTYFLPPALRLSTTNSNNLVGDDLAYIASNGALAVQYGQLITDYFLNEKTQYVFDLTEYIKNDLRLSNTTAGEGLLLTPPSPNFETQFARLAIGNKNNEAGKIQLIIYYAAVK